MNDDFYQQNSLGLTQNFWTFLHNWWSSLQLIVSRFPQSFLAHTCHMFHPALLLSWTKMFFLETFFLNTNTVYLVATMNHNVLPEKWSVNERVIFEHILQRLWHDQWTSKLNMSKENKHKEYVGIFSHLNLYLFDKFTIRFLKLFQIISYI